MKNILQLILLLVLFQSCLRKRNDCIELYPKIISNKAQYNQFDKVKLKVLYSERASYKWFFGDLPIADNTSEITLTTSVAQGRTIYCEATIGNCIQKADFNIFYNPITVPSCSLLQNSITIDSKQMQIGDMVFNPVNKTFRGKIKGPGATINDSIKIDLVSINNFNDSISLYNIFDPITFAQSTDNAKLTLIYGNLTFKYSSVGKLVYRKTSSGGNLSCCTVYQSAISIPSLIINAKFSFDFTF